MEFVALNVSAQPLDERRDIRHQRRRLYIFDLAPLESVLTMRATLNHAPMTLSEVDNVHVILAFVGLCACTGRVVKT